MLCAFLTYLVLLYIIVSLSRHGIVLLVFLFTGVITHRFDVLIFDHTALAVATSFLVSPLSAMCLLFTKIKTIWLKCLIGGLIGNVSDCISEVIMKATQSSG